ncbi:MAG: exopolysaccharide biosynthesis polyprenyl glycosylphosphotransferase [Flavobacteriaceae bacterium]
MNTFKKPTPLFLYTPFLLFEIGAALFFLYVARGSYETAAPSSIIVLFWIFSALAAKLYHYERNLTYTKQLQRFIFSSAIFSLIVYIGNLIVANAITFSPYLLAVFFFVVFITKAIAVTLLFWLRQNVKLFQKNILVYDSKMGKQFVRDILGLKRTGYNITVVEKQLFEEKEEVKLKEILKKNKITSIYIPFEVALRKSATHILNLRWEKENELFLMANYDTLNIGDSLYFFGLTQIVKYRTSPLDDIFKAFLKRVFDVLFSLIVILFFLSWFVPLVAIIIVLDSKGTVFFIQKRPGRHGKMFSCIKFRSMTVNKNTEKSATRNDARITRIGKFIRKTSIDEFPQFFNVLKGDMSVVGPRPNLTSQNKQYSNVFQDYAKRMYLKPGITGLAQVSGARGGIEHDLEMKHRIKYDIFYIRHWSFALDIKIIIRTALNVIRGEDKAY